MEIMDSEIRVEHPQIEQLFKYLQKKSGGKKYLSVYERKKKLKLLGKTTGRSPGSPAPGL